MIRDIGEILNVLRDSVKDFETGETVTLLDGYSSPFKFPRGERLERKRFVSLVNASLPALAYLTRNLTTTSDVRSVERGDFAIGAIDYRGTLLLWQRDPAGRNRAVMREIHRDFNTPENQILAITLLAVLLCSTRAIQSELTVGPGKEPSAVLRELEGIRGATKELLKSKRIKEILPVALANERGIATLFERLKRRIEQGRIPPFYSKVYEILTMWRNYLWVVFENDASLFENLRHHFDTLNDENRLYECWVYYKILSGIQVRTKAQMIQTSRSSGTASFRSADGELSVTYQMWADTGWDDQGSEDKPQSQPWDQPDVVIKVRGRGLIVLDAKNSFYKSGYPNREQMQSYMESLSADFGIFVHSRPKGPIWHQIERGSQKMVWTSMEPVAPSGKSEDSNGINQKILDTILAI